MKIKPSRLDRVIGYVSPKTGFKRLQYKAAITNVGPVQRRGGQKKGTLFNWIVKKLTRYNEGTEREAVTSRAQDLTANHPHATSCIESMTVNSVGSGLMPQSQPKWKLLNITEQQAKTFAENAEWVFRKWSTHSDINNRLHFGDQQYQTIYSFLMTGEYLSLPTMRKDPPMPGQSKVRLALQALSTERMATPSDLAGNQSIRDGVKLTTSGGPSGYYVATPKSGRMSLHLTSKDFTYYPAWIGHRPGVLHSFHAAAKEPDRVRGVSILAPAMKFFRDLSDYLDFELVGAIVASSFPVFVEKNNAVDFTSGYPTENPGSDDEIKYQEVDPGQIMYGNPGEKPHVLKNERPGNTFDGFVETILRAVGASVGMPYEVVAKDFSKTNYSSARAALLEAWRVYKLYRTWLERHYCHPVWCMVLEEAWLRGELTLPPGGPDFYDAMAEYTNCTWIGPSKGHVDPLKEMKANIMALQSNIATLGDLAAEQGRDWESQVEQRGREKKKELAEMPVSAEGGEDGLD